MKQRQLDVVLRLRILGLRKQELEQEPEPELELKHPVRDPHGPLEELPGRNPAHLLVWPREEVQVQQDLEVLGEGLSRQVKQRIESQFHSRSI